MAESRRIALETVEATPKENKVSGQQKSLRFNIALKESNEKTCPEFSYNDLVKTASGKIKAEQQEDDEEDPFGEGEDDEVLKGIARKFEEKYGPKSGSKFKNSKMGRWEDYVDRGMGYDENDPFIDNDEAYDELVPSTLTTQFGGFYINSGELEFRQVSESESNDTFKPRKRRRHNFEKGVRKKRLTKDDSKSDEPKVPKKRGRKPLDRSAMANASESPEESALNKMRRKSQPTVAALLQERKAQQQQQQANQIPTTSPPNEESPVMTASRRVVDHSEPVNHIVDPESPLAVPVIASSSDGSLENLLGIEFGKGGLNANLNEIIESVVKNAEDILTNGNLILSGSSDSEEIKQTIQSIDAPKLPDNLPNELNDMVHKIKQAALISAEGKCKFFNDNVNRILLSIEVKSRELSCTQRSMIYSHLASFLPCTKETLLKRAKKLRLEQEGGKLASPMERLGHAVNKVLPGYMEKYKQACITAKSSTQNQGVESDQIELPKKKFDWTENLRDLLCEVVRIKLKCYEVLKMRTQSAEEYLYQFLDLEVRQLWPSDWMTTKILLKESRNAHEYITSSKNKKAWLMLKKNSASLSQGNSLSMQGGTGKMSQEMAAASGIIAMATGSSSPPAVVEEFDYSDCDDSLSSSNKLVIASPPQPLPMQPLDVDSLPEMEKPETKLPPIELSRSLAEVAKEKADIYAEDHPLGLHHHGSEVLEKKSSSMIETYSDPSKVVLQAGGVLASSPSKRIFTLMNTDEAVQIQPQHTVPQSSFAAQMLDRIICASLANFPNSSTSGLTAIPEIGGKPIKTDSLDHKSQNPQFKTSKTEKELRKETSVLVSDGNNSGGKSASNIVPTSPVNANSPALVGSPAVSILKSNYPQPRPPGTRTTVLDHGSNVISSASAASSKHASPKTSVLKATSSMPYQAYEFQEAFKRSLGIIGGQTTSAKPSDMMSSSRTIGYTSSVPRQSASRKITNHEEEPMNFSAPPPPTSATTANYTASQELNRLAAVTINATGQSQRSQRAVRVSPDRSFSVFPEGMKGFPMPLKTVTTNSSSANLQPPPAHSYPSRRMSPSESVYGTRTSSQSPHQSSAAQSPPGHLPTSVATGLPHSVSYQPASPLSHYTAVEVSHALSMGAWQSNRPHSPTYTNPSQYSGSSVVVQASSPCYSSLTQTSSASNYAVPNLPQLPRGGISVVHKSPNIPVPAHQSPNNQVKPVNRNIGYNALYGQQYQQNSQRSNQQSSHQRIP